MRKDGGEIPTIRELPAKFQYGGNLGKTQTKSDVKSTDGLRTDITATHKTNGEDGGLTNAEYMQIAAAAGDLVGVGLSFIPGAHIGSAITGLGATALQFAGDVKKDGFQLGDLGSAALSGLMDVGTLFGGAAGKIPKAIKAVTAAAQPLMKLFAAAGIVNGAQALGKVVRGEEVTSEDMISILRGLTSTAIGAKMVKQKIGDATLSKRLEDDVLKTQNANVKTKPAAEIGGKKIEIDANDIKGKTKTEVETILKERVKAKLEAEGVQFDEAKHGTDLSKKFGINYDKGEFEGLN